MHVHNGTIAETSAVNTQPLVSIVTPVYNTAEYLSECIESVLSQSYQNWEYVILDNQSTDGSARIAEEYARKDPRIRLVRADVHLRQLPNFNRALRLISPRSVYCKMLLADDWLFPECIERMVRLAEGAPRVGIVACYLLQDGRHVSCQGPAYSRPVLTGREACRLHLLRHVSLFGTPTSVLYRSEIVRRRNAFYPESSLMGDTEACHDILKDWDFGFVHQVLAAARVRDGSIFDNSLDFNPFTLQKLITLYKYGRNCLSAAELHTQWDVLSKEYRGHLGECALRGADAAFWEYHRRGWEAMDFSVTRARLAWYALVALADYVLNPKRTVERVFKKLRSQWNRVSTPAGDHS